ncbi:GNAT family N-acetyltransferase [Solimonas sp. SE-A11]|uniref:GNAT family N-acetyltransferase n=1 Tax=Solimonas sp. SE-A11 TaxID=3054954 RepID=UPI003460BD3E
MPGLNYPRPLTEACLEALALAWRPEVGGDYPFLESLYIDTRWDEFAALGWPEAPLRAFLASQFAAQCRHYAQAYRDVSAFRILLHDGRPIGRLYLYDAPMDSRIIDITLVASCRGKGIGRTLLCALIADARATSRTVSIHVESNNPARRLYDRLGFQEAAEAHPPYLLMQTQLAKSVIEASISQARGPTGC